MSNSHSIFFFPPVSHLAVFSLHVKGSLEFNCSSEIEAFGASGLGFARLVCATTSSSMLLQQPSPSFLPQPLNLKWASLLQQDPDIRSSALYTYRVKVQCMFCFEIGTPGRGRKERECKFQNKAHRSFDPRKTSKACTIALISGETLYPSILPSNH